MSLLGRVPSLLDIRGKSVRRGRRVKRKGRGKMKFTSISWGGCLYISNMYRPGLSFPTRYLPWKQQRCSTECDILTCRGPDPNFKPGVSGTMRTTCMTMHTKRDTQNVFLSTNWLSGGSSIHFHLQYNMYNIYIYIHIWRNDNYVIVR